MGKIKANNRVKTCSRRFSIERVVDLIVAIVGSAKIDTISTRSSIDSIVPGASNNRIRTSRTSNSVIICGASKGESFGLIMQIKQNARRCTRKIDMLNILQFIVSCSVQVIRGCCQYHGVCAIATEYGVGPGKTMNDVITFTRNNGVGKCTTGDRVSRITACNIEMSIRFIATIPCQRMTSRQS